MKSKGRKSYRSADPFFRKLMKNPDIRVCVEQRKAKDQIAAAVHAARLRANISQEVLARKVGTSQSVIARLEGPTDTRVPSLDLLWRISVACGGVFEIGIHFKKAARA